MNAIDVYAGSDGEATKRYYSLLATSGPIGEIAVNLFRAQKSSARAKVYRGGIRGRGSFRAMAYECKGRSIERLCKTLLEYADCGIAFGWKKDPRMERGPSWVLYVDLPEGQVSFHSLARYDGPDYRGDWDGQRASEARILALCNRVQAERLAKLPALFQAARNFGPVSPTNAEREPI